MLPLSQEVIARAAQSAAGITNDFAMIVFILASSLVKIITQALPAEWIAALRSQ